MTVLNGTSSGDVLIGTSGDDTIYADGGNPFVHDGNNQMDGGAGNDWLRGGSGNDVYEGGTGVDTAEIVSVTPQDTITASLLTGTAAGSGSGNDTLSNIENVWVEGHSLSKATVIGNGNDNYLAASTGGANVVSGGGGNDLISDQGHGSVLDGGSGTNALALTRDAQALNVPAVTHTFSSGASGTLADGTSYSNFQFYLFYTGDGDDDVTFTQLSLRVPYPQYQFGNTWDGGGGNDTATIDLSNYSIPLLGLAEREDFYPIYVNGGAAEVISLLNIENFNLIGGSADDIFNGGRGTDSYTGGGGNDVLKGGSGADLARYSGLASNYRIDQISAKSFTVTDLRNGSPDGTDTLTDIERIQWGDNSITALLNSAPTVVTHDLTVAKNQSLALSSLFSVSDVDGDAVTLYQLWDSTADPNSGHFAINGVAQPERTIITITPSQLAQVSFVTGMVSDYLQIRATNGGDWSATDAEHWAPFTITVPANWVPQVTTVSQKVSAGQTLALSSLFSYSDVEGDPINAYHIFDYTSDPNSGHFVVSGVVQAANSWISVSPVEVTQTFFVTGTVNDVLQIDIFDATSPSPTVSTPGTLFTVGPTADNAPVVHTAPHTLHHGQSLAFAQMASVSDTDGDPITAYQLLDSTTDSASGHFVVNNVAQAAGTVINVLPGDTVSFVAGSVADSLQIRASDGTAWSAADNVAWSPFIVSVLPDTAPSVTTTNKSATHGQTFALSSLFSVSDADNDTITRYQLWDGTADPLSGHFVINGVAQLERAVIDITAAQVAQTSFVAGTIGDNLIQIRAYDGAVWSQTDAVRWAPFNITVPTNTAPVVSTADKAATHGQTFALSSLFSVSDADNDTITKYQLWDANADPASGYFVINGQVQAARTVIDITAAQVVQTSFVAGMVSDGPMQIRAFDGFAWSQAFDIRWSPFNINVAPNNTPVVSTANKSATHGQIYALSSLFSVSDADNDTITRYQLWDGTADPLSGHFVINGVAQPERAVIDITAAQVAQTSFVAGLSVSDNFVQIRAFDGLDWSQTPAVRWAPFDVTVPPNTPPVVSTADKAATHGQVFALSSLFSVSDGENDTITRYQLWDGTADPLSGHFVINGVAQPERAVIDITAAQVAQTSFVTGVMGDSFVQIRAFDGLDWSQTPAVRWAPFNITVPPNNPPVVSTVDKSLTHGSTVTLSSLFSVNDADSDTITAYEIWDATADPLSGHFIVNGAPQPERTVIDITPGQLGQTTFLVGAVGHDDDLQIRAFDGYAWSQAFDVRWNPFHVTAT